MKAPIQATLALSVICWSASIGLAAGLPINEPRGPRELSTATAGGPIADGPIVVHRRVYRNESLPALGSRLYDKLDYELELRRLTRDIRIAETELELRRARMRGYDKHFGYTDALLWTRQQAQLDVLQAEEQLKLLRHAKLLALRHRNDRIRYRELLLDEGAGRVRLTE